MSINFVKRNILIKDIPSSTYYWVYFFIFLILHYSTNASEFLPNQKLTHLSHPDRKTLENFLKVLLKNSEGGYVLYGNKPICFQTTSSRVADPLGNMNHHMSTLLNNGISVWEKAGLPKNSNKFILHVYQTKDPSENWQRILLIN